ncbi:DUF1304 domain-containing protein [Parvularcula marina]|uniref:DUF1304 domain-containing protein n=1 Tax=Parvularcula marina TaxID=2292771 RepID=A0A371RK96_9PROT|nr:DUF1304 domain-containing protein [Parvularcula marina]RFB05882.1 DUF1304 domain-containing protein [Parvularcula marina]
MTLLARIAATLIGLLHLGFLYLEMVLWTTPTGQEIFGTTADFAEESAALALNQGLYNGFLAAGLLWAAVTSRRDVAIFFLLCVIVAGAVGAWSVSLSILWIQAVPGAAALLLALLSGRWAKA